MIRDIKNVNYIFFATMLILLVAGFFPFSSVTDSKLVLLLISQGLIFIPATMYFAGTKSKYSKTVGLKKIRISNVLLIILFTYCMIPVMGLVNGISRLYAVDSTTDTMTEIVNGYPFIISLICIAIVPAVLEETVYRGIFYQKYRKVNPFGAIFLSAFMFGILHGNLNQFTYAFFMGIIFALMIEATDSIASTMIMHFIINGNSVVMLYVIPKLLRKLNSLYQSAVGSGNRQLAQYITDNMGSSDFTMEGILSQAENGPDTLTTVFGTYVVMALFGGILAFLLYRTIAKRSGRWEHVKSLVTNKNRQTEAKDKVGFFEMWTWPLTSAVVILIINMLLNELIMRGIIK